MGSKNMRTDERRCTKCKIWKPATYVFFAPNRKVSDGCTSNCRDCENGRIAKRSKPNDPRTIYFVRITVDHKGLHREGQIKLGRTTQLRQRISSLRTMEKIEIEMLGTIEAQFYSETVFKRWFYPYRVRGQEWFLPAPELLRWIEQNANKKEFAEFAWRRAKVKPLTTFERFVAKSDEERGGLMAMIAPIEKQLPLPLAA